MKLPEDFLDAAKAWLPEAAARALALSPLLCRSVHAGHDCAAYHAIRPFLLWFGMGTGPWPQKEFFRVAMRDAVRDGARRVLVSGAADHNLPALVLWTCADAGATPEITVIDVCETPLRLCTEFAGRTGVSLQTAVADARSYRPEQPFDVIAAHSFLGYFRPADWPMLVASWRDALVAGGRVILANRVRPNAPDTIAFNSGQTADFHARLLQEAKARAREIGIEPERLAALTEGYAAHSVMFPLRSLDALAEVFEAGGFRILSLTGDPPSEAGLPASPGPTLAGGAQYAKLVAVRR